MSKPSVKKVAQVLDNKSSNLQLLLLKIRDIEQVNRRLQPLLEDSLKKYCLVANINERTLTLLVANSSIASQIRFQTPDYLKQFKTDPILKRYQEIICKIRPLSSLPAQKSNLTNKMAPLSAETAQIVHEIAESLADPALKKIMQKIANNKSGE